MKPFIFAERNGIHIIDLAQTVKRLDVALEYVTETVARGESVLFVGTKKQAQEPVMQEAIRAGQPYVTKRWLGGMLTNFVTIKKRIGLMDQLEARQLAGDFDRLPKKEAALLTEELTKLQATLGGIRKMKRLPGAIFIVDPHRERIAVTEANKLEIPVVGHGRHQRRPGRARLHHPGQRRRDPRHPAALPAGRGRRDRGRAGCARPARPPRPRHPSRSPWTSPRSTRPPRRTWSRSWPPAARCRSTPDLETRTSCPAPPRPMPARRMRRPRTRPPRTSRPRIPCPQSRHRQSRHRQSRQRPTLRRSPRPPADRRPGVRQPPSGHGRRERLASTRHSTPHARPARAPTTTGARLTWRSRRRPSRSCASAPAPA